MSPPHFSLGPNSSGWWRYLHHLRRWWRYLCHPWGWADRNNVLFTTTKTKKYETIILRYTYYHSGNSQKATSLPQPHSQTCWCWPDTQLYNIKNKEILSSNILHITQHNSTCQQIPIHLLTYVPGSSRGSTMTTIHINMSVKTLLFG